MVELTALTGMLLAVSGMSGTLLGAVGTRGATGARVGALGTRRVTVER